MYCGDCGQVRQERPTGKYDVYTGEDKMEEVCVNPKCVSGCENAGGHRGGWFSLSCKRCGKFVGGFVDC